MFGYAVYQLLCVSSSCCIAFKSYMSHIHIINLNQLDKMLFSSCIDLHYKLITDLKFMFSKKATKIDEIFTVDLTLCSKCQIDCEDFVNFCGLLRKHELY